jgi:uncharacterized membrane protein
MTDNHPPRHRSGKGVNEKPMRDKLFQWLWIYLRGWLLIIVTVLVVKAIGEAHSRLAGLLEPLFESFGSSAASVGTAVAILTFVPWALGLVMERLLVVRLFQRQRGVQAFRQLEQRLSAEFHPDDVHAYRVALIGWPSATVRSLGVVTATFREPETDRELAAVYLPGTPDPSKGWLRVLAVDDLVFTDWTLRDIGRFHVTFGSACPDSSSSDEPGEPERDFGGDS